MSEIPPQPQEQDQSPPSAREDLVAIDSHVIEEKAEALKTNLLMELEEMAKQMHSIVDEAAGTLYQIVSDWEQQEIDALKEELEDIQQAEHDLRIRQGQLQRFIRATCSTFVEIFEGDPCKSFPSSQDT